MGNMEVGQLVVYAMGGIASIGATTVVSTFVAMSVKSKFDKRRANKEWDGNGKDRRNGSYEAILENMKQSDEKFKSIFGSYVPKIEEHDKKIAVLEAGMTNILDVLREIRKDLRNGHGK